MRLWSFQFPRVLRILRRDGVYRPRWNDVKWVGPAWVLAYEWMVDEMIARGHMRHRHAPIWAWRRSFGGRPPGQSAADSLFGPIDYDVVRLELEIPDHVVLLSDYGAWSNVTDLAFNCIRTDRPLVVPQALRRELFSAPMLQSELVDEDCEWQACLPDLRWRHVCGIRRYTIPDLKTTLSDSYSPPDD